MTKKTQRTKVDKKPVYKAIDLRMTEEELAEVTAAAEAEAKILRIPYSRNNFCVRAVLAAARKLP